MEDVMRNEGWSLPSRTDSGYSRNFKHGLHLGTTLLPCHLRSRAILYGRWFRSVSFQNNFTTLFCLGRKICAITFTTNFMIHRSSSPKSREHSATTWLSVSLVKQERLIQSTGMLISRPAKGYFCCSGHGTPPPKPINAIPGTSRA